MTIEKSNTQGASDSSELLFKFILENKLTLKEIGAFFEPSIESVGTKSSSGQ